MAFTEQGMVMLSSVLNIADVSYEACGAERLDAFAVRQIVPSALDILKI